MSSPDHGGAAAGATGLHATLAAIVVFSDDAIISKDLDSVVQTWNAAAERIFGYSADEMIGQSILRIIPPERAHEEPAILERIRRGERVDPFTTARVRKDGTRVFVSISISPIVDADGRIVGASKIARDVTRAAALEATHEAIIASADDAIISKSLDGVVLSWNHGAETIFGYSAAEMVGQPLLRLFPADRVHEEADILARIRRGERVDHFETVRVHRNGRLIDISATISPIRGPTGEVIAASKVARDITPIKRLNRELESLLVREQDARREAERSNRVKDEFLATLSHELRTPLNSILGWAQLLQAQGASAEQLTRGLATIERNARAQAKLIDDLLDVSRIVSGKMQLELEQVDLAALVVERCESLRPAAQAKDIRLTLRVLDRAAMVLGDARRLNQIAWNLLSNAIRYTPKGGHVEVSLRQSPTEIELEVKDDGMGIDADFLPSLFNRFTQADSSSTRQHSGLGLGLAIVRHLAELHGGTVAAQSPGLGLGAVFTVRLPRRSSPAELDAVTIPADARGGFTSLAGLTLLVVDDNADALEMSSVVLEVAGATVLRAGTTDDALALLAAERVDAVISDIAMPVRDGYELLRGLRDAGNTVPVLALTAFARAEDRHRSGAAGFIAHLQKPIEPTALVDGVAAAVGRGSGRVGMPDAER